MSAPPANVGRGRARGRAKPAASSQQPPVARGPTAPPQQAPMPSQLQAKPAPPRESGDAGVTQQLKALKVNGCNGDVKNHVPSNNGDVRSHALNGDSSMTGRGGMRGKNRIDMDTPSIRTRPQELVTKQGSYGMPVQLCANYFKLEKRPNWELYQYRVDFSEEEDRSIVKKAWLNEHKEKLGKSFVFDGTVLFTVQTLTQGEAPLQLVSKRKDDDRPITINIKFVGLIHDGHPVYLQLFNLIMRRCMGKLELQLVGRNLFDPKAKIEIPEFKIALWPGYLTSIRQHENDLLMCVEITHKVMRLDTALDVLIDCSREYDYQKAYLQAIIGTTVLTPYNNKTYRVDDVDFSKSPSSSFPTASGGETTFVAYYKEKYDVLIKEQAQPLLISRAKSRDIRAGKAEQLLLIPELCRMTGLTDKMRTNFQMMKALANHMFIRPKDRVAKLNTFNRRLMENPEISGELTGWDMQLSKSLVQLTGRALPSEKVIFGQNLTIPAGPEANWTRSSVSKPMLVNADFRSQWVVVVPKNLVQETGSFVATMMRVGGSMGFHMPQPEVFELDNDRTNFYCDAVDKIVAHYIPELILFIVKNNNVDRYAAIKKKCYVDRAISSQVVLAKNLSGRNCMTVATKVAIQLNCKLGGAPWSVEIPTTDTMAVGFDVCHDKQDKAKSYGALVATMNKAMTSWFSTVAHHGAGEELSNTMAQDLVKACRKYADINGKLPGRIMIYRDGVGDGQLNQVFHHEVEKVKTALSMLYEGPKWKMAYIIVTKRINARVFKNDATYNNVSPGTIVDDVITLPEKYDFYLVAQHPMQGTASPISYNILFDNIGWSADIIQRMTYKLTHLYYNFSGTVCVPAPCQYAHKLAFLIGQNLHTAPNVSLCDRLYFI